MKKLTRIACFAILALILSPLVPAVSIDDLIRDAAISPRALEDFVPLGDKSEFMVVELDIKIRREEWEEITGGEEAVTRGRIGDFRRRRRRRKRNAIKDKRWTYREVPYLISNIFTQDQISEAISAIDDYERMTCLRFRPSTDDDVNKKRLLFSSGDGCRSNVGMQGGDQSIELAPGCRRKGIIMHEIGHAVGMHHEQTRPDRDSYVDVHMNNIIASKRPNFMKKSDRFIDDHGVPYDYLSMMHYGEKHFSFNGKSTIVTKDPAFQKVIGQREGFSFRDVKMINLMYDCASECPKKTCPGEGFVGKDCKCWCPSDLELDVVEECGPDVPSVPSTTIRTTAAPPTTAAPGSCTNEARYHAQCQGFADRGFCSGRYERFMHLNCRATCGLCGMTTRRTTTPTTTTAARNCRDQHRSCASWASTGECRKNPRYMLVSCARSCNSCPTVAPQVGGGCTDDNTHCDYWARTGECQKNRPYMLANCARSCNACQTRTSAVVISCTDHRSTDCPQWAGRGFCSATQFVSYMRTNCRKSCRICTASAGYYG
ncbi:zinc metalloproteinase nas-13-like [Lineus longissimus]|uniref:zinc metalloproteinase nas-13-like n=1 Tax=Lineus longissimus TaxID=88925 RepID=UPI00315C85FF